MTSVRHRHTSEVQGDYLPQESLEDVLQENEGIHER